jgi:hypothetical protein
VAADVCDRHQIKIKLTQGIDQGNAQWLRQS